MHRQIAGVYRNGKVELLGDAQLAENTRVTVSFDDAPAPTEEDRQKAVEALIALMNRGLHLGGGPYPKREEIYDRERGRSDSV